MSRPTGLLPLLRPLPWVLAWPATLLLWLQLTVLGFLSLGWNAVAMLLYPVLPAAPGRALGRAAIAFGYRGFWRLARGIGMLRMDATALDALRHEPGLIVIGNHPSLLDAVMLVARLPRSACIMKDGLLNNWFLGAGARLARYVSNASAHTMLRGAVDTLRQGGQLVLFPEGTRTTQWPVNPFHPSVTVIARLAQAPIQTVFIDTDSPYLSKGWPLWKLPPLPIVFTVRLGRRFAPGHDAHALARELQAYYEADMQQATLQPQAKP